MFLNENIFRTVIENTPLIAIDLIVKNTRGQVLLGRRVNEPAFDFWFVPGGRIFKDESLDVAFNRIVQDEIGLELKRSSVEFDKVYEHFYKNNVFNNDFSTHYIVLAHKMIINKLPTLNIQHSEYSWFNIDELLNNNKVHKYTKDYFRGNKK